VAFISLRDNLDLTTPSGRLMMHIIGGMAQFERELIKERVSAGMHAARKRGSRIGRPRVYANVDKIRALRAQDVPWRVIASQLSISTGTAIRTLQNCGDAWRRAVGLPCFLLFLCFLARAVQPISSKAPKGAAGALKLLNKLLGETQLQNITIAQIRRCRDEQRKKTGAYLIDSI
jgi:Resolvase, N terminal domain